MKKVMSFILILFVFNCGGGNSSGGNCSNIIGEWDAATLDVDILDDIAGCEYQDYVSDASHMNWAFQMDGVVEQNDSSPGVWTVEKYFECTANGNVEICSNAQMTNECMIYNVTASNYTLSLERMIVEGNACDRKETLHFIPEDD